MNSNSSAGWRSSAIVASILLCGSFALSAADAGPAPRVRQFSRTGRYVGSSTAQAKTVTASPRAGGLVIVPTFDSTIMSDPRAADIMATINTAIAGYEKTYSNPVTVAITFIKVKSGLGSSSTSFGTFTFSAYRAALAAHATTPNDLLALAHIASVTNNPVNNDPNINIATALARALGFDGAAANPAPGDSDSNIMLQTDDMNITPSDNNSKKYSLASVVSHEIDEALGMGSNMDGNKDLNPTGPINPEDLFRYDKSGARSYTTDANANSYFSIDGITTLAQFNQDKSGDFGDWYSVNGGQTPQVQDAFGTPGSSPVLGVELTVLDVIGYTRAGTGGTGPNHPPVITSPASFSPNPAFTAMQTTFTVGASDPDNDTLSVAWDFGDGTNGSGASAMHLYSVPGDYTATATVTDGLGGMVTSSVAVKVQLGAVKSVTLKQKFGLNFKTLKDSIDITMIDPGFIDSADGTTIKFLVGGISGSTSVTVDTGVLLKSKAKGSIGSFTQSTRAGTIRYSSTKASLQAALLPFGAVNSTVSTTINVPIYILFNNVYYGDTFNFSYDAKAGKSAKGN